MANPFFRPGTERAERVRALFSRIATRYDLINDLQSFGLHRHWKRRLVELSRPQPGQRALDVCCGTGDLALALAERGLDVIGVDFTEAMLVVAQRRAQEARAVLSPVSNNGTVGTGQDSPGSHQPAQAASSLGTQTTGLSIAFQQGDALQLPFPDGSFDVVTVGYGLRNLADWERGLSEMQRVAKPGGRLLVLDFGKPENSVWRALYFSYLRVFVPLLGLLVCGSASAYAYILESLKQYPAQRGVAEKMRELSLDEVRVVNFLGGVMSINYGQKPAGAAKSKR